MENDIVGERLKGLYKAILQIADIHELQEKVKPEIEALAKSGVLLAQFQTQVEGTLAGALSERDQLRVDCAEITKQRQETRESRELLAVASRDKITLLQEGLEKAHDEISTLKMEQDRCDKLVKSMEDEITKMRIKLKQNRLKRRQYGEAEEKICKKCQRVYMDSENYNWSCRTHKGEYSDEMWWCCGKTTKDAPGCLVSKHESKDEEEEQDNPQVKEETERQKVASMQCPVTFT
jgi:chromosome segregation ATPase